MGFKNLRKMGGLNAKFGPLITAVNHGTVSRSLCEVYFLAPFSHKEVVAFQESRGIKGARSIYFFNETAVGLAKEFGVSLPAPVGTITRAELEQLPGGLGTLLHLDTYSAA